MESKLSFSKDSIKIDPVAEVEKIVAKLRHDFIHTLKKRGAVVGVSGGVDSAVVLALCAKALGAERVLAVMMPEKESSPDSLMLAQSVITKYNVAFVVEDITAALTGFGCYQRRDLAVKSVFPEYDAGYKAMLVLQGEVLEKDRLNLFHLKIISAEGKEKSVRLPRKEYLEIVAAANFKQRSRMSVLYHHAECRNYGVVGTGNKDEHELGFFVKYGDGAADVKPIMHLFKTQVGQLAEYLEIPLAVQKRAPTTDTYGAEQTQAEFFFRAPFEVLDRIWYGWEQGVTPEDIAAALSLTIPQVQNVINDIVRKRRGTEYLRLEIL